jgi:predicted O-methyltransferase YrrM
MPIWLKTLLMKKRHLMNNTAKPIALQIEEAVKDIPGWSPLDQLLSLYTLAFSSAHLRGDILELGSWCGRSAVALGMAAWQTKNTKVHCVDLFPEKKDWYRNTDGTYSFELTLSGNSYGAYRDQTVWEEPFLRDIAPMYQRWSGTLDAFNFFMTQNGLATLVTPYRGDLDSFANNVSRELRLRLAFIDGDHSFGAVCKDIEIVERFLLPGGWICFDDAFSSYEGVNRAIQERILESGKYARCQQLTRKFFVAQRI